VPLKDMPFTKNDLEKIATKFPTPFHIYDEKAIRENARDLLRAFEWNEGFDTPAIEFQKARQLNAIINLDDIIHIPFLEKNGGIPEIISVRYNPGKLREGSFIMGNPENAKYGFTREQIFAGLSELRSSDMSCPKANRHHHCGIRTSVRGDVCTVAVCEYRGH
jgi:diaminopimelate decarboxylase